MTTVEELKTYYADTLIAQYKSKARARATIGAMTQEAWCDGLIQKESVCFDLYTAVGAQLDILGKIVGLNRNIYGLDLGHTLYELTSYTGSPVGTDMQRYADDIQGPEMMLRYNSTAIYTMSDFEFRTLIEMKIAFNTVTRTLKDIIESIFFIFDGYVTISDNLNMSMTIYVSDPYKETITIADYIGIIPKAMGVSLSIVEVNTVIDDDGSIIRDENGNAIRG